MSSVTRTMIAVLSGLILGGLATAAPVPPETPPDPLARGSVGIQVQTGGLVITTVYPTMPAGLAGLKVGDKIVRVGTLEPQVFDQVVAHICSFRPGSTIEFEVERGSDRKVFKVKIAPRPAEFDNPNRGYPVPIFPDR
jgi:S1-C subfamily serine protease